MNDHKPAITPIRALAAALPLAALAAILVIPAGSAVGGNGQCFGQEPDVVLQGGENYKGTNAPEVVVGSGGDNTIRTRGGNDSVCAGDGDDRVDGGAGNDEIFGHRGNDVLRGRPGEDELFGFSEKGPENDFCLGGKPFPDTQASHDTAEDCSESTSVFEPPE